VTKRTVSSYLNDDILEAIGELRAEEQRKNPNKNISRSQIIEQQLRTAPQMKERLSKKR